MAFRFQRGEPLADAFRRVATEEVRRAREGLASKDAERGKAIHNARRGFKRMRALLRLAKPGLGSAFEAENHRWRDAGRLLAPSRDAAVLLDSFDGCARRFGRSLDDRDRQRLREGLEGELAADLDGKRIRSAVRTTLAVLDRAEGELAQVAWPASLDDVLEGFRESQSRLRKAWRSASDRSDEDALHDWRKRLKDRATQIDLFSDFLDDELRFLGKETKKVGEVLGNEHDLAILNARLAGLRSGEHKHDAASLLIDRINERRETLRRRALRMGPELSSQAPNAFARHMKRRLGAFAQ